MQCVYVDVEDQGGSAEEVGYVVVMALLVQQTARTGEERAGGGSFVKLPREGLRGRVRISSTLPFVRRSWLL